MYVALKLTAAKGKRKRNDEEEKRWRNIKKPGGIRVDGSSAFAGHATKYIFGNDFTIALSQESRGSHVLNSKFTALIFARTQRIEFDVGLEFWNAT